MPARESMWKAKHKECQKAVDNVKADLMAEIKQLREALEPMEAWVSHTLTIMQERRLASQDQIEDGDAILQIARRALRSD